jgi:proteasome lid subunit RPN8/RPN11
MGWFGRKKDRPPRQPPKRRITKVNKSVIDLIGAAAQAQHPNEFGGTLRAQGDTITEVLLVPGTVSGATHAIFQLHMLPIDLSVKGTVHSHPGGNPRPSNADRELFSRYGTTHIIIAEPYNARTWRAYDGRGDPIQLEVVPG